MFSFVSQTTKQCHHTIALLRCCDGTVSTGIHRRPLLVRSVPRMKTRPGIFVGKQNGFSLFFVRSKLLDRLEGEYTRLRRLARETGVLFVFGIKTLNGSCSVAMRCHREIQREGIIFRDREVLRTEKIVHARDALVHTGVFPSSP